MTPTESINQLCGRCCELEAQLRDEQALTRAYRNASVALHEELERAEANVQQLMAVRDELREALFQAAGGK